MNFLLKLASIMLISTISLNANAAEKQLTDEQINTQMHKMADHINKQLPRKVDDIITLLNVSYDNKTFSYFYKVDDLSQLKNTANVEKNMIKTTCATMGKIINEHGFSYHYNYVAPNDEQIMDFTINKASCNK